MLHVDHALCWTYGEVDGEKISFSYSRQQVTRFVNLGILQVFKLGRVLESLYLLPKTFRQTAPNRVRPRTYSFTSLLLYPNTFTKKKVGGKNDPFPHQAILWAVRIRCCLGILMDCIYDFATASLVGLVKPDVSKIMKVHDFFWYLHIYTALNCVNR